MPYPVHLTDDSARDLEEIWKFVERHDSPGSAEHVLNQIEKVFGSLPEQPLRGTYPTELLDIGLKEYREVFFKPYRVVYRVKDEKVFVMLIADGRRDMRSLLERRLLRT